MTETPDLDTSNDIPPGDVWLSSAQVCTWFGIRKDYLYDLVASGTIPHVKINRLLRFKRSELEQWIEDHRPAK